MTPENESAFLDTVKEHCQGVRFKWADSGSEHTGAPENAFFQDEACVKDALWQRTELLRMLMQRKVREEEVLLAANNLLEVLKLLEAGASPASEFVADALKVAKDTLQRSLSDTPKTRLARHAPLLERLGPVGEVDLETILNAPREELESRLIIQKNWLSNYAKCLDGLGIRSYMDGKRLPDEIRRDVSALLKNKPDAPFDPNAPYQCVGKVLSYDKKHKYARVEWEQDALKFAKGGVLVHVRLYTQEEIDAADREAYDRVCYFQSKSTNIDK